jgi:soluble lytic murein transglycosylase
MRLDFFERINPKRLKIVYKLLKVIVFVYIALFCAAFLLYSVLRITYPIKYHSQVVICAEECNIDCTLIFAMIKVESGFNERAESHKGAKGLMQITDRTGKYVAEKLGEKDYDLKNAQTNIRFGCYYIKYLYERFENTETMLAAYNAGEGNVSAWLNDERYSADKKTLYQVPFKETREYIEKIKKTFEKYRKLYGNILDKR